MKTITLEEHFVTRESLKLTGAYGPGPYAELRPKLLDLGQGRIAAMDAGGIDLQILSAAAMGFETLDAATGIALTRSMNDELAAAVASHPTRFGGFAALPMKDPDAAAKELERCVTQLGFAGAMIAGTTEGLFLDAPRFLPVLEAAAQFDVPIYLHPAPPPNAVMRTYYLGLPEAVGRMLSVAGWGWHAETGLHTLRLICSGVFDRLPKLQVVIGHMGEGLPYAMARSSGMLSDAARLPQSVADYFQTNVWVTTSGYFSLPPFECALAVLGIDRLMYSVDYPFSPNTRGKSFVEAAATIHDESDMRKLTHENAMRVLRLT